MFEQLLVPRGLCLVELPGAAGRAQPSLCVSPAELQPQLVSYLTITLRRLTWSGFMQINVYSATLPGGRSCRAELHEPARAAVLQGGWVLVTLGTAGPGLEVLGWARQQQQRGLEKTQISPGSDASVPVHFFPSCSETRSVLHREYKNKFISSNKSTAAAEKLQVWSCPAYSAWVKLLDKGLGVRWAVQHSNVLLKSWKCSYSAMQSSLGKQVWAYTWLTLILEVFLDIYLPLHLR